MPIDKDFMWERLDGLWQDANVKALPTIGSKYVLFSDIHLGDGRAADDFVQNRRALAAALDHYFHAGFTLILLGDIEELWQFDLQDIAREYDQDIYRRFRSFGKKRLVRVFGNHDREWGGFIDPSHSVPPSEIFAPEAIKLLDGQGNARFLLVHGHQGSLDSDKYTWFSRFWARMYSGVEPFLKFTGFFRSPSATKSQIAKDYERTLYKWAKLNKVILICGHSHRAIFASQSYGEQIQNRITDFQLKAQARGVKLEQKRKYLTDVDQLQRELEDEKEKGRLIEPVEAHQKPLPCYFNTGCCLYTDGLTAIEIEDDDIRLVKWNKYERQNPPREVFNEGKISAFVAELH